MSQSNEVDAPLPGAAVVSQTASQSDLQTFDVMAQALLERGLLTPEQASISRIALTGGNSADGPAGGQPPAPTLNPAPAPQAAAQDPSNLDAVAFAAPDSPAAYQFTTSEPPAGAEYSIEFESVNRAAFHAAGIPKAIGDHIAAMWNEAAARDEVSEQDLALSKQSALVALNKLWGADTMRNIALAETVVARIAEKQPGVWDMLRVSGMANDPWLISTLYNIAQAQGGRR
jgi:hypothetical protein